MTSFFNKNLLNIIISLSVVGLADAMYLSYARYMHVDLPCSITNGGCSVVAASPYAVIFGMPLAYLGVLFYSLMLVVILVSVYKPEIYKVKEVLFGLSIFGVLDSVYFLYLQGYVINAFCIYCIISAGITFVLLPLIYKYYKLKK